MASIGDSTDVDRSHHILDTLISGIMSKKCLISVVSIAKTLNIRCFCERVKVSSSELASKAAPSSQQLQSSNPHFPPNTNNSNTAQYPQQQTGYSEFSFTDQRYLCLLQGISMIKDRTKLFSLKTITATTTTSNTEALSSNSEMMMMMRMEGESTLGNSAMSTATPSVPASTFTTDTHNPMLSSSDNSNNANSLYMNPSRSEAHYNMPQQHPYYQQGQGIPGMNESVITAYPTSHNRPGSSVPAYYEHQQQESPVSLPQQEMPYSINSVITPSQYPTANLSSLHPGRVASSAVSSNKNSCSFINNNNNNPALSSNIVNQPGHSSGYQQASVNPQQQHWPAQMQRHTLTPTNTNNNSNMGYPHQMMPKAYDVVPSNRNMAPIPSNICMNSSGGINANPAVDQNAIQSNLMTPGSTSCGSTSSNNNTIWSGTLNWQERQKTANPMNCSDGINNYSMIVNQSLNCQICSVIGSSDNFIAKNWPRALTLQVLSVELIQRVNSMFKNAITFTFNFPPELQRPGCLHALYRLLAINHMAGIILFPESVANIQIMILLYSYKKKCFVGLIPLNQIEFFDKIKALISQKKQQQQQAQMNNQQQHVTAPMHSSAPSNFPPQSYHPQSNQIPPDNNGGLMPQKHSMPSYRMPQQLPSAQIPSGSSPSSSTSSSSAASQNQATSNQHQLRQLLMNPQQSSRMPLSSSSIRAQSNAIFSDPMMPLPTSNQTHPRM